MKKLLSIMLTALLALSLSSVAFAAQIQEANINKVDTPPQIDGQLDAFWEQIEANKMTNYIVAEKDNAELDPVKDPEDFSGQWRAAWDEDNIYVLVEITDPIRIGYNFERDGGTQHRDDSVQVSVGEGDSHLNTYFHIDTLTSFGAWTNTWEVYEHDEILDYAINDYGDGYIVEVAIPWEYAGIDGVSPAENKTVNFEVHAVDNDLGEERNEIGVEGRYPQSKLTWNDTENKAHESSEYTGKVTLLGAGEASSDSNADNGAATTPDMPKTGMGGTDTNVAPWVIAAAAVGLVFFVGVRKFRSQSE